MVKSGCTVHVLSDCITSYDKKKLHGIQGGSHMDQLIGCWRRMSRRSAF